MLWYIDGISEQREGTYFRICVDEIRGEMGKKQIYVRGLLISLVI